MRLPKYHPLIIYLYVVEVWSIRESAEVFQYQHHSLNVNFCDGRHSVPILYPYSFLPKTVSPEHYKNKVELRETKGIAMTIDKKDVATLIELLKMEAERLPHSEIDQLSESELFRHDCFLLEMWPEACRRTGVGRREFPPGVIELWKNRMGVAN